jgi:glycogen synthase
MKRGAADSIRQLTRGMSSPKREAPIAPPGPDDSANPHPLENATYTDPPVLFEVGWEVCWQLGGIYTVLKTKAAVMKARWDQRYFLIGPYNPKTAPGEFEAQPAPPIIEKVFERLRDQGIVCHFGRWLVPGRPNTILLDYRGRYGRLHEDKFLLFQDHGIATPADDGEVNDVIAFGFCVTEFFRLLAGDIPNASIVAHFHEWMAGVAVPRIAHLNINVSTVFTTHATLLGRYLAGDNPNFYDHLPFFNADAEADKYRILPRHLIEKAAAHASTVFTTVSQVTSVEAERLLGRRPDCILPNGIDVNRFEAPHELQHLHSEFKDRIHQFTMGHFFPSYSFDLDRTLYFFIAGRYEYRNKGIDMFIESLHRLNERLKWDRQKDAETRKAREEAEQRGERVPPELQSKEPPTVVAFIITKAPVKSINIDVLENQARLDELARYCDEIKHQIGQRIFLNTAAQRQLQRGDLIDESAQINLRRLTAAFKRFKQPHVVTHDLIDDIKDPTLNHIRHRNMVNGGHDPVKMVFHPQFVTATSPLLGMDYDDFIRGCHLGIFPSYYEPWGYTPMECIVSGIPAVTSDLSGFGAYVQGTMHVPESDGLKVITRRGRSFDEATNELTDFLYRFVYQKRRDRIAMRNRAESLAERFDWKTLAEHYHESHDLALARRGKKTGSIEVKFA